MKNEKLKIEQGWQNCSKLVAFKVGELFLMVDQSLPVRQKGSRLVLSVQGWQKCSRSAKCSSLVTNCSKFAEVFKVGNSCSWLTRVHQFCKMFKLDDKLS